MLDKKDDIFLARWINGELSEDELRDFKSHPDYNHYVKINAGINSLDIRDYDIEKELSFIKSKSATQTKNKNTPIKKLWPYMAVAASIAIIFSIFLYSPKETYTTGYGEQISVALPDGSEMILNAKSIASFDKKSWNDKREVSLTGEAFFKVKKGEKFTVVTNNGNISVLGTQFNVQSQGTFFEVACFEGKVSVQSNSIKKILTPGKGYRSIKNDTDENWSFTSKKPSWTSNTSSFRSVPIKYVFKELEEQYHIKIKTSNIDLETIFTGNFPNNNKEVALRTVFSTLDMDFSISQDGKTVNGIRIEE